LLRWLALVPLVAFALSCLAPARVDLSRASGRRTVAAASQRTVPVAQVGLTSAGAKLRIRSNAPSPRQLGLFHAEDAFSLAKLAEFVLAANEDGTRSRLVDQRAMIRRLCRTQHRPAAAPANV
jgi:hypothetical protein